MELSPFRTSSPQNERNSLSSPAEGDGSATQLDLLKARAFSSTGTTGRLPCAGARQATTWPPSRARARVQTSTTPRSSATFGLAFRNVAILEDELIGTRGLTELSFEHLQTVQRQLGEITNLGRRLPRVGRLDCGVVSGPSTSTGEGHRFLRQDRKVTFAGHSGGRGRATLCSA